MTTDQPRPPGRSTSSTRPTSSSSAAARAACRRRARRGARRRRGRPCSTGYGCFGGNITQVGVESFGWYRHEQTVDSDGHRPRARGAGGGDGRGEPREPVAEPWASTPSGSSSSPTSLVEEAGITPMLHRLRVAPIVEDGAIRGVITESKSGREAILAKRVVDATGDADVAARAGAPVRKTPREEMLAASVMFSMTGREQAPVPRRGQGRPARPTATGPATPSGTSRPTGKEDELFSPFLRKPFKQAVEAGLIPTEPDHARRHLGHDHRPGRPDVPQPRPPDGLDGTDRRRPDPRRDRGPPAGDARDQGAAGVHAGLRGRQAAQLRDDHRDPRHAQDRRALRPHRATTSASRRRFEDSIGIFPEFIDGYGILDPADDRAATSTCRTARWCRRAIGNLHRRGPLASAATRSRTPPSAT